MNRCLLSGLVMTVAVVLCGMLRVFANAGPFVIKYPGGNPASRGVLARLDPDLKPGREERLRVVKEDLHIVIADLSTSLPHETAPLATVTAAYTIENPTTDEITLDFGFPILRGIYISPLAMLPTPDVTVTQDGQYLRTTLISNSLIYGIIRQRARDTIEKAIAANPSLAAHVSNLRTAREAQRAGARVALARLLTDDLKWNQPARVDDQNGVRFPNPGAGNQPARADDQKRGGFPNRRAGNPRNVALMIEYASIDLGPARSYPADTVRFGGSHERDTHEITVGNMGPLSAIGEQRATQFLAQVATCFDPGAGTTYESIFSAWGGDVRERSVDLLTGKLRPREFTLSIDPRTAVATDPTVYARVDYLDPTAAITEAEKSSCRAILNNLPVIFTFAPMNLLHYQAKFPARSRVVLTVAYRQHARLDTGNPESYQLGYVVHPASFWKSFGPIDVVVDVPRDARFNASVSFERVGPTDVRADAAGRTMAATSYRTTLREKTGELFVAVDAAPWKKPRAVLTP